MIFYIMLFKKTIIIQTLFLIYNSKMILGIYMKKIISKFYNYLANDSLYRNSIYLMLSTGVMAVFGFFFWIINARLYSAEQVGIGTTLISIMTLISSFSLLGLGNSLIKYLPTSDKKNEKINTSFTLVGLTSIFISIFFLVFLKTFSPRLLFVRENIIFSLLFILFIVFTSLNAISENVFIAYRSSKFVLIKNTISSIVKLILPIFLVALGAYGIVVSMGIAIAIAFLVSLVFLILRFNYSPKPIIDRIVVKRMTKFSLGNYVAGFIGGLPAMVLPILITNSIGAKFSAYFYMDMMIANLLYIIPSATSQALFAEGSYSEIELKVHLKKAIKIISIIIIPAIIVTFLFGKYILLAFGKEYSSEGVIFLQILAISGIFISINCIGNSIFYIKHRIKLIILVNFIGASIILSLSIIFIHNNLLGIGVGWMLGQGIISVIYLLFIKKLL
ncbi:MAG TPA: oligosaccharide flippase family protein [Atribacterota bacterium]|nr:oligosaccharide flippase family protein [Atribacterota bacterium]